MAIKPKRHILSSTDWDRDPVLKAWWNLSELKSLKLLADWDDANPPLYREDPRKRVARRLAYCLDQVRLTLTLTPCGEQEGLDGSPLG
jgi:hypothetical protein